ncbi:MAG: hypothetical protein RL199_2471, partial [Pseudomonadota bacterium]
AGGTRQSTHESRTEGTVVFHNLAFIERENHLIARNRNGELAVIDGTGRERERYNITYGAKVLVKAGQKIEPGTLLAEWDPFNIPIVTDVGGIAKFGDVIEGVTMSEQQDEVTGLSRKTIIDTNTKTKDVRPRISIKDSAGETKLIPGTESHARYGLVPGAVLVVNEGDEVLPGDVIAKIPRESTKTKDITGGLPRVVELFEARKPKDSAIITEIDGQVSFGKDTKGKRKVIVTPEVEGKLAPEHAQEYLIPKAKTLAVHAGDRVKAGEPLMDGAANPHDILKVKGAEGLARYLVNEVQEVYRLQGVKINDKHIEVIVRQMLRRVRVVDTGDTRFLVDESVENWQFAEENERVEKKGGRPATSESLLLGITKASLSTESFISASSFQETTKVLTEASIKGQIDYLRGLKENVIMGRLIPAGTGVKQYGTLDIQVETSVQDAIESNVA